MGNWEFNESKATRYISKGLYLAVLVTEPVIYLKPHWAGEGEFTGIQSFGGPHYAVMIPQFDKCGEIANGWDLYGCDLKTFEDGSRELVTPLPGMPEGFAGGLYRKRNSGSVLAYKITEATTGSTVVGGKAETSDCTAPMGHSLVKQPGGEIQIISPPQFEYLYRLPN